ncbi:hypothetical protein T265_06780 [Opisthorchis viverrini]|uniref:Uncharacterized protein n=1 Tax=Opisthorchis viverrini TaxID=6198 RepID=A0A075AD63_OPIVI|nr:hypothetical protein T265_06780 [Opisthorchis viverrini]KER25869.1 hypothetical protein T265_06780 [Opisthorchis viverrini]
MVGCWVQIVDQSDLALMPDPQASRILGQPRLRSRGSLGRMKYVNRSCSGVPSFRSNSLTFHPSSNLEKSVLNMPSYRLNQESNV